MRLILPILLSNLILGADPVPVPIIKATSPEVIDDSLQQSSFWQPKSSPAILELDLNTETVLGGLHLFSGANHTGTVSEMTVEFDQGGTWVAIPSAVVTGNYKNNLEVKFDGTVEVKTKRLRLTLGTSPGGVVKVREVRVWSNGGMPVLPASAGKPPLIYLNQSGFGLGRPKRFTAPTLADGTAFNVRPVVRGKTSRAPEVSGIITGGIGNFSSLDTPGDYVVEAGGLSSVPFGIGPWWLERVTTQGSVDFFIDSRHYLGTYTKPSKGSFGWRDDHSFGWELHALVTQLLANPAVVERLPRQITYQASPDPKLWGALHPPSADAPDLVKLIHWGADVLVTQGTTHEHLKAQLAYFLYAWPVLSRWLPEQNKTVVAEFARHTWGQPEADRAYPYDESPNHDLFALKTKVGSTKGCLPPGASVEPNVLMATVAKREGWPEAAKYLNAAVAQADWMIKNLDWEDPQVTKGQRMSEFITVTGLSHLLQEFPDKAPVGLAKKLDDWVSVIIRRSDNLWDFRKLDDGIRWTPMDPSSPQKWNEAGNVVGLPAAIFAALPSITDPERKVRLETIAHAHFDNAFGRNPTGRHFDHKAPSEIEGVEFGWFSRHPGGIGQLEKCRFVLDGSPKDPLYPYHPEVGNVGWTEGWIQFNTPFNTSMAYLARHDSTLTLTREGGQIRLRLKAPIGFDPSKREKATVALTAGGTTKTVVLVEETEQSEWLSASIPQIPGPMTATYGFGWMATTGSLGK